MPGDHRLDPIDRLELATSRLEQRQIYNDQNRRSLLVVHGVMGVAVGGLIQVDGSAKAVTDIFTNAWALALFEVAPFVGGALLLIGLAARRHLILEAAGMAVMWAWDIAMALLFLLAAEMAGTDGNALTTANAYPVAIYTGLAALLTMHLITLAQMIRGVRLGHFQIDED